MAKCVDFGSDLRKALRKFKESISRKGRTIPKAGEKRWFEFRPRILRTWVDSKLEFTIPTRTRSSGCWFCYNTRIPYCITFPIFITKRVIRSIRRSRSSTFCISVSLRKCAVSYDKEGEGEFLQRFNGLAFILDHSGMQDDVPLEDWRSTMTQFVHVIAQIIIGAFTYRSDGILVRVLTGYECFVWEGGKGESWEAAR